MPIRELTCLSLVVLASAFSALPASADYQVVWITPEYRGFPGEGIKSNYLGDFDGDGRLEVAFGTRAGGTIEIVDAMTGVVEFSESVCYITKNISAHDLDGDGTPELLVECVGTNQQERVAMIDFVGGPTPVPQSLPLQKQSLSLPTPNPLNPSATIHYSLATSAHVRLAVYDASGRLVRTLADESAEAGRHAVLWDGRDNSGEHLASGTYFYALLVNGQMVESEKAVILR